MKKILFLLSVVVFASSCVVKPYKAPSAEELALDKLYAYTSDTTKNMAQTPWREVFVTPELVSLIDTVLAGNIDSRVAMLRVEQSYAMLRSSRASIAPSISADAQYVGTMPILPSMGKYSATDVETLGLNWEIDIWGKLYAGKEAQKADFWSTQEAVMATRQSLVAAAATAYFQLVVLDAQLEVIENAIDNRESYVETTQTLKESGKVSEVAVQQAIAQLAQMRAAKPAVELAIELAENSVALLAGKTSMEIRRNKLHKEVRDDIHLATGVPAQLLSFRPDVRAAEMNYRSKHYLHMAARASLYPSLSIGASGSVSEIISAHNLILNTLAGLTAPIFNGRKLRSQKEVAAAEAQIAKLQFQNTLFKAVKEVNDALISVKNYDSIVVHQSEQLEALNKAYEYSGELFLSDYVDYLDVLVAQVAVYDIEQEILNNYFNALSARIELFRALGGGSDEVGIVPPSVIKNDPILKKGNK